MNKKILYGLILLITLSLSLGVVSASDNFANETIGVSLETPANDIQLEASGFNHASEIQGIENTNSNSSNSNLLGVSNEDVLGKTITPSGTTFKDIRDAIDNAIDGDIIDLGGLTYTGTFNKNLDSQGKNITIQNGIIDGSKLTKTDQVDYSKITLKNMHFKNFNYYMPGQTPRIFAFSNSILENVKFSNCTQYNFKGFFASFNLVNATNMSFDGITSGTCVADIKRSTFINVNFTNSRVTNDTKEHDIGQFTVMGDSTLIDCNFINTTSQQHAGAICMGKGMNIVKNTNFINCTAWVGGAIYAHGDFSENKKFLIENCTFINCSAEEEGGALGLSHNNMEVKDCKFINNTATKGAGIMIGGIYYPDAIDGDNTHGHNITIDNCYFENNIASLEGGAVHISGDNNTVTNSQFYYNEAPEGGAVHITGDNATVIDSVFDDNLAHDGKGAAVYVEGNYSSIDNSTFTNHESERGTVYIIGNYFNCTDSEFINNTATLGGAGLYMDGDYSYVNNNLFNNNNATVHGGAIHTHGSYIQILNSDFISNHAIPNPADIDQGLGGAIYIRGDNNRIAFSYFNLNTARNGSAVYNRGNNLSFEDDDFEENQAWSYLLPTTANPELSYYSETNTVKVEIIYIGGDNIINAIHNDGSPKNVFFYNVTYDHSTGKKTTTADEIHPRDGVENSEDGKWLYQDSREDLQTVNVDIVHKETGEVVYKNYDSNLLGYSVYGDAGSKTGLYGNITVYLVGLNPGNYTVNAEHPEDLLYKEISNSTKFEILPVADLAIVKEVSNKTPNFGDIITWTLKVTNNGPNDATGVYVTDKLPAGLIYVDSDGNYDVNTHTWTIGDLAVGNTVVLNIRTIVNISNTTILNVATVNSTTYDPNETNNKDNNTTKSNPIADLSVVKLVSDKTTINGNIITWTIIVKNNGPDTAVNAKAYDVLPKDLIFVESDGNYDANTHIWTIGDLTKGASATLKIKTIVNTTNTKIVNNVHVNSSTPDSNESNNNASNDTEVLVPGLNVKKITLDKLVTVGNQVKFEIVVTNTGKTTLNNVFVEESSYDGLTFDHAQHQDHWVQSIVNGKNRWTLNTSLVPEEVAGLIVVFNTTNVGNFTNVVVAGSDETENKTTNNTTKVVEGKLDVKKITINPVVLVGDQVTFEILVKNIGEVTLSNVFVEESSYTGLTYDSFVKNGYWTNSVVNGKNRWTLNTNLAPNEAIGLFVVFNTTKTGNFTNVVVAGSDETENKTTNNTTKVVGGKFDVQKITLTPMVHVGNQTSFEIIVRNTGEVVLHDVVLEETSYDGLIYDSFVNTPLWTHSVANGKHIWTLNKALNVDEVATLIVNFNTIEVGNFTNIVTVSSNETGNKVANNTTIVYNQTTPDPQSNRTKEPNISIQKIALDKVVIIGNQAIFEIIVTNTGNVVLHDVTVTEDSFTGLIYDSWYDSTGLWQEDGRLKWIMKSPLYTGEIVSFYVVFNTTTTGRFTNVVSVDSNETNKKSANDTVEVIKPDFAVEKISINRSVLVGEQVMFEIVVHNLGQVDLTNVVVREDSFSGLIYDSFIDYSGLWTKNSDLSWTLTTPLRAGEYEEFFVVFNTTNAGNFVNVVVADSNEIPNKTDNDTVEVLNPSLDVQKITINRTVNVGEQVMFEIVVHNTGKVILNDVTVRENSFDGLTYDSFIDYYGVWTKNSDLSWTLNAPLYAGEYLSLFVVFNTTEAGTFTNIVSASSDKTKDKPAENTTTVTENPKTPMADLAIAKVIYSQEGNKIIWGIYVVNQGPDKAVNTRVTDVLPKTLKYVNSVVSKGTYDLNTGVWFIGDMENGEEATMIIETIALTTGLITNEANVTSDTFDPDMSNNYDNESVTVNDVPETPQQPKENVGPVHVTPATGNPLIMVLLALIALGTGALRRRK